MSGYFIEFRKRPSSSFIIMEPAVVLLLSIVVSLTCTAGMLCGGVRGAGCRLQVTGHRLPVASVPVRAKEHVEQHLNDGGTFQTVFNHFATITFTVISSPLHFNKFVIMY